MSVTTKAGLIGQAIPRREDPKYLTGRGRYLDDLSVPRMLHAAFVRSPHAHARVGEIDASAALAVPGVHAVITGEQVRAVSDGPMAIAVTLPREDVRTCTQPVLPTDKVRFVGEAVAIVVAASRALAEDGAELVEVAWEPLPAVTSGPQALAPGAPVLHDDIPDNSFAHIEYAHGDVDGAFARAAHVFSKRFEVGRSSASPLEPRGIIAAWDPATSEAEIWSSCGSPGAVRGFVSLITGVPESRLRCHAPDVGGSFGVKGTVFPEESALLMAAKAVGRPLKWVEDRIEHLTSASHAKQMTVELELAVDADGRFLACKGRYLGDAGAYAQLPPTPLIDVLEAAALLPSVYDLEAIQYVVDCPFTSKSPAAAARGVGWSSGQIPREALIDEVARALGRDPLELRLANCLPAEPTTTVTGLRYDGGSYAEAIRHVAELAGYDELRAEQARLREQGRYLGIGVSPFLEVAYSTAHARAAGTGDATYDSASVTIDSDGSVVVRSGFNSQGQGHQTTLAQVAADVLGVPLDAVRIVEGDTDAAVFGFGTFGSRTAAIGSELIALAGGDVREKLVTCAAHLLGCGAADIEVADGVFAVRDDPARSMPLAALAGAVYYGGPEARPHGFEPVLSATRFFDPPGCYTNGAIVAAVEVDPETGMVDLRHLWLTEDCGTVLNPLVLEGQLAGGMAQGVGMALLEELIYDDGGQLTTATLMDYLYPTAAEVPGFTFGHLETPAATSVGAKGAGEGGTVAAPAAIVQAVADALAPFGARATQAPLRPDRVLAMIDPETDA